MATIGLQYRNDGFATITNIGGVIEISAPTWRAKHWATKQLKREASAFGITLKRKNGAWYADSEKMEKAEYRLFAALKKCCESPTSREVGNALKHQIPFRH